MEAAARRDFLACMQAEVFDPLEMRHTRPDRAGVADPDRTHFYKKKLLGGFAIEAPIDSSYKWSGGGFLSTADDLALFGSALLQPGFLREESLAQLFTAQKPKGGKPSSYGIGWGIANNRLGRTFYLHGGDQQGASSFIVTVPKAKIVVAILTNLSRASLLSREDPMLLVKCFDGLLPAPPVPAGPASTKRN
jgi:CubicO group peptidase (beta-lactamase class C family)